MTPVTPRQAREAAELYRDTGTTVSVKMVFSLADQVEVLTKERDALLVAAKYAEHIDATPSNQVQTMLYDTLVERDELRLQIDVQAGSIEAVQDANQRLAANHKECVKCLGDALQDRANLAAAAKLAVAALDDWYYGANQDRPKATVFAALQALKKAGVQ